MISSWLKSQRTNYEESDGVPEYVILPFQCPTDMIGRNGARTQSPHQPPAQSNLLFVYDTQMSYVQEFQYCIQYDYEHKRDHQLSCSSSTEKIASDELNQDYVVLVQ